MASATAGEAQPVSYTVKHPARALTAVQSDKLVSTWIVGTNALREENELRILQYDADQERLVCSKALTHAPEIWDIAACPTPQDLILTVWSQGGNYGASLWSSAGSDTVSKVADLGGHTGLIRRVLWHPSQASTALTVEEGAVHAWSLGEAGATCTASAQAGELLQLWSCCWQPQSTMQCATAGGNNVQVWDLRTMTAVGELVGAHRMPVRDVCYSGSREHRLVSAGDDCKVRVWDTRVLGKAEPLLELGGHSHWVWRAQFCPFHEQLIASCSSDTLVNLYHTPHTAAAVAPAAAAGAGSAGGGNDVTTASGARDTAASGGPHASKQPATPAQRGKDVDGKVRSYDEHEDSVYGLAWSAADPWLFASLSYDGRMVVNKVPKNIKYKLLV